MMKKKNSRVKNTEFDESTFLEYASIGVPTYVPGVLASRILVQDGVAEGVRLTPTPALKKIYLSKYRLSKK